MQMVYRLWLNVGSCIQYQGPLEDLKRMKAGVYLISNNVNGKCYVGSTIHLDQRRKQHFSRLAHNKHVNKHLQNAYNKYGREAFEFEVLNIKYSNKNVNQLKYE